MVKYISVSLILFVAALSSCKISYSFTDANISPDLKTVGIKYFQNRAPLFQPTISQVFTEALKDKFTSQTNLAITNGEGDLSFEGEISDYKVEPIAISGNQTASLNRLTITVRVKFTNVKNSKKDFDTTFSRFQDYESTKSLDSVERQLIKEISDLLVDDIFKKAVVNW